ncbi:stress-responsive transcription factor hsf1 [Serendipita sp. 401]|nr:stress-responsive transcription factor hsf1 [Serendipita sp. 397]KAG8827909.1 stress-responsive transcription factor hsf1 [Serendipita sp. 401]KAG9057667.1 stress-responsive transcription factor hsf1 [Serendipita sp. 407]
MSSTTHEAGSGRTSQIPQFLNKLLAMVDDATTDKYIKWADDGSSFYVFNPEQFAKEVLSTYYKTDASASFVRQLNMYGFHKVPHVRQGALKTDKQAQAWHYRNDNFLRGRPDLLPFIARKGKPVGAANANANHSRNLALQPIKQADLEEEIRLLTAPIDTELDQSGAAGGEVAKGSPKNIDMTQIINGLATIKRHQTLISDNLKELQSSNQALWQEAMEARERHRKHQETINRILKFLASLFQGTATAPIRTSSMSSTTSDVGTPGPIAPRPRLMIEDVADREEDNDDVLSTPRSSVRMEEVEEQDSPSHSRPSAFIQNVETPKVESPPKAFPNQKGYSSSVSTPSNSPYPFSEQNMLPTISPAEAWKMIQWLQQNQIPIPYAAYNPSANAGALTTLPPTGMSLNPMSLSNITPNAVDPNLNFTNPTPQTIQPAGNASWMNYGSAALPHTHGTNVTGPLDPVNNPLYHSILPLTSISGDPPPPVSLAQVSKNGDKLDQLSNNVEAMQHGIDSLIEGMGLDPLSAASLQTGGFDALGHPEENSTATHTNGLSTTGSVLPTAGHTDPTAAGSDLGLYQMNDFDFDALLKQLGAAAAANTPPAYNVSGPDGGSGGDETSQMDHLSHPDFANHVQQPTYDSLLFNDINMYNPPMTTTDQDMHRSLFQEIATNGTSGSGGGGANVNGKGKASSNNTYLNETPSPVMTRSDSSELSSSVSKHSAHSSMMTDQASSITAETTDRNRFKKRKLEEGGPASTNGPKLTSTNTARSAKRRK